MHRFGRTFVRLSAENRSRLDRFRKHHALSRDRMVNQIVADYFDRIYTEVRLEHIAGRRRSAA